MATSPSMTSGGSAVGTKLMKRDKAERSVRVTDYTYKLIMQLRGQMEIGLGRPVTMNEAILEAFRKGGVS